MNQQLIMLKSLTEANKAKRQLSAYRIKCEIEKVTTRRGNCSYALRIKDASSSAKVCRLLSLVNIKCGLEIDNMEE